MNKLDQLKQMSDVVADTDDIAAIEKYRPSFSSNYQPTTVISIGQSILANRRDGY